MTRERLRRHACIRVHQAPQVVLARTGLSQSTIYCKIAEGTFRAQFKISTNGVGWKESDINR